SRSAQPSSDTHHLVGLPVTALYEVSACPGAKRAWWQSERRLQLYRCCRAAYPADRRSRGRMSGAGGQTEARRGLAWFFVGPSPTPEVPNQGFSRRSKRILSC